ncbi:hypothetical protein [Agromyces sp. NPDC058104]|uniref:hypothetical protein n=1 Tax=Agromyces sp. NPDC058104 TaxID=3346342 RepID=UPI0036DA16B8
MRYWRPDLRSVRRGEWIMFDGERKIAIIRLVTIGLGEYGKRELFRAVTWAPRSEDRDLIGYFPDRHLAAVVVWSVYQRDLERARRV